MIVPDANLLVYAYDVESPQHPQARDWWESVLSGPEAIGIPYVVLLGFTRIMTHPRICKVPITTGQAQRAVNAWLETPVARPLAPMMSTLKLAFKLLDEAGRGGNLVTDAFIAAHALESGGTVYSNDRDFRLFPRVRWVNPLA